MNMKKRVSKGHDLLDSDIESDQSDLNYKTLSAHLGYVFRRNIRMIVETNYDFKKEFATFSVGVVTAF